MRKFLALCGAAILFAVPQSWAQQSGGVLRITHRDSPASLSIHEEGTNSVVTPAMAIFNNLVIYDQHKPQNSLDTIVPELATSWTTSDDGTKLTFKLREGVKWHDGKPFTSADVKCTFDLLLGRAKDKFRLNFRAGWYSNLADVTTDGDYQVTMHLKRRQPSFIALLASGYTPMYPCHVSPATMRTNPIGTGPFKFAEFKRNESIRLVKNPDYWKKGLPYLDGIEFTIIPNRSTAILSFVSGRFDMTFPYDLSIPLVKDLKAQMPEAVCQVVTTNVSTNLLVNRDAAPFNNPDIRRAVALTLDRRSFIKILSEDQNKMGGAMLPAPEGTWGMPKEIMESIPGYGPDVKKNREAAQEIMRKLGYGPDKRLSIKVSTRNIASYRDPAVILIDQLKEIYIDAELDVVETAIWHAKIAKKDFTVGLNLTGSGVDDPDQQFYENYACGSMRNYTGYCNKELDAMVDQQSMETDIVKRRKMVWEIDRQLQEDLARPIIMHNRGGTCHTTKVKNLTLMVNSIYNGWRLEDVWLEK
ncbi:MAG: ABC transporter substrate-binding protein [Acetobacteraceae bacterium]